MNERVKYIASFDIDGNKAENRNNVLSSANKINYIVDTLNKIGYGVDIISTSHTLNKKCYSGKIFRWGNNTLKLFPTTWRGRFFFKILNSILMQMSFLFYLLVHLHKKDIVIIYHSYATLWFNLLIKFKGATLIVECEEIYGDIFGKKWMSFLEHELLKFADAYIYPTLLLNKIVNKSNKPYLVVHGAYRDLGGKFFSDNQVECVIFDSNIYHVAYTGILDPKKGCLDVVKAAEYLDSSFYIHILGFGSQEEICRLNQLIDELKNKTDCHISYDGVRKGIEYSNYLSKINLGICALDHTQSFVNTQFPSKIISYMAAGIPVLCSDIETIKTCDVADGITFYHGINPIDIADGIKKAREKKNIDIGSVLKKCDEKFIEELTMILKKM